MRLVLRSDETAEIPRYGLDSLPFLIRALRFCNRALQFAIGWLMQKSEEKYEWAEWGLEVRCGNIICSTKMGCIVRARTLNFMYAGT